jgi:predicted dehydrogenase
VIRVALIGFGFAGKIFHAPLIAATAGLHLAVIGSRQDRSATADYPDAEVIPNPLDAISRPDVDLVVIATPNDSHAPLAEAAMRAGKHVVVDKPFTITLAEARALATLAAETGQLLSVFQNRRWDSDFQGIRREIAAGRIGEIVDVRSEFNRYRPDVKDRWRERPGPGSGMWYDLGPHLIDQSLVLFGPPDTVQADFQMQRRGGSTVDWFQATLGYGPLRVVIGSTMLAADPGARFLVRGTDGSLTKYGADPQEAQIRSGVKPGSPGWGRDTNALVLTVGEQGDRMELTSPDGNWPAYYAAMRDAVLGTREVPVTPAQATTVMAVLEAGIESAAAGRVVRPEYEEAERVAWAGTISVGRPVVGRP